MSWKVTSVMDQKVQLIADWKKDMYSISDLSKKHGVSRPTVYKWINRYEVSSLEGLNDLSKKPLSSPNQTPSHIVDLIIQEKLKNRKRGPKKILVQLKRQYPDISWPSNSTASEWLKKHGLVIPRKKRQRVANYTEPFKDCQSSNSVWSADYKGQFYTKDNKLCYPLTISDNYSRYLISCEALEGPRYNKTRLVFEKAFKEHGLPQAIRTDNGNPFATTSIGGLSRLMVWWIKLGIIPERIEKGCPEQNGRHERMHKTLKYEVLDEVSKNITEQQQSFDWFRYDYNHQRPHESLNQSTPSEYYTSSKRPYTNNPPKPDYPSDYKIRQVRNNGEIRFNGKLYFLTNLLDDEPVGLKPGGEDTWDIYYSFYYLGTLDLKKNKIINKKCKRCPRTIL